MSLKGTRTEQNRVAASAGESQPRNRCTCQACALPRTHPEIPGAND